MQVEQPHHPPGSFAEFLRQYAMIVLSILTALWLEQAAVSVHNHLAAQDSRARIEAELAHNLTEIKTAEQSTDESIAQVRPALMALIAALKAGPADPAKLSTIAAPALAHLSIALPAWQRNAWDSAVADQSAGHLPAADLRRYAEIYTDQAEVNAAAQLLLGGEWLTQASEVLVDFRLGKVDGRTLVNTLSRYMLAAKQIQANEQTLRTLITDGHLPPQTTSPVK